MRSSIQLPTSDPNPLYAPCWHLLGEHGSHIVGKALHPVGADRLRQGVAVVTHPELDVRPVIVDHFHLHAQHRPVAQPRQRDLITPVGAVMVAVGDVVLTVLHELHRSAGHL